MIPLVSRAFSQGWSSEAPIHQPDDYQPLQVARLFNLALSLVSFCI